MRVTLIRHGKTAGNAKAQYIGRTDDPLSPEGVAQLEAMKPDPSVPSVYVTSLRRTQQTAAILFPNAEQILADGLREMDFGDFEGRSYADMEEDAAYRAWVDGGCLAPCPNGESREIFSARVCSAFADLLAQAEAQGKSDPVFVVHGGTIMAIMERFALPRRDYYDYSVKNGRGYACDIIRSESHGLTLDHVTPWEA